MASVVVVGYRWWKTEVWDGWIHRRMLKMKADMKDGRRLVLGCEEEKENGDDG